MKTCNTYTRIKLNLILHDLLIIKYICSSEN